MVLAAIVARSVRPPPRCARAVPTNLGGFATIWSFRGPGDGAESLLRGLSWGRETGVARVADVDLVGAGPSAPGREARWRLADDLERDGKASGWTNFAYFTIARTLSGAGCPVAGSDCDGGDARGNFL